MPVLDGYALVRAVRQHVDWSELPIIVMTSRISETRRECLLGLGADACLSKPFGDQDLLAALERAVERRQADQPAA
jgi:chemosensory pili system protein ChpA (sensor histidine kinase/response regulator)